MTHTRPAEVQEPLGTPCRVLLCEDNDGHARLVRRVLRPDTFHVVRVGELNEIEPAMAEDAFDVLILDLHLPDSWAQETFKALPSCARCLPIVVMSSGLAELEQLGQSRHRFAALLHKGQFSITSLPAIVLSAVDTPPEAKQGGPGMCV